MPQPGRASSRSTTAAPGIRADHYAWMKQPAATVAALLAGKCIRVRRGHVTGSGRLLE
jgi:hypothetical protein